MIATVNVGSATIIALSDGQQPYAATAVYPETGEASWSPYRDLLTADGQVLLNFGCYLVRADGRTILVDAGLGPAANGTLLDGLDEAGVRPDEVDMVVFTHLHGDHTGWNLADDAGTPKPRFSRARYLVPEGDWRHYGAQEEPPASFRAQVQPLERLGVMDLVGGDHALTPSVTTVATPGHTPGHLSVAVTSGGEHGFILGDVVISPVDAHETDWVNRFDWDAAVARDTRRAVLDRLERDGALVGASHLPAPGLGRFVRRDGRRVWEPLSG